MGSGSIFKEVQFSEKYIVPMTIGQNLEQISKLSKYYKRQKAEGRKHLAYESRALVQQASAQRGDYLKDDLRKSGLK